MHSLFPVEDLSAFYREIVSHAKIVLLGGVRSDLEFLALIRHNILKKQLRHNENTLIIFSGKFYSI